MRDAPMLLTDKGKPDTTARHVLAAQAEFANADGTESRPSLLTLQYRTGYDRRTIQRALRRLEVAKQIKQTGVVNGCPEYKLALRLKRPASDLEVLKKEEEQRQEQDAERQRRHRAKRVTHSDDVTVTDAECVTEPDVTDADAVTSRTQNPDVTDGTPPDPSFDPPVDPSFSLVLPQQAVPQPPAAPVGNEREEDPLTQKLMGIHAATAAEVGMVFAQVKRERRIGSVVGWAVSETGSLDFAARLAEIRRKAAPAAPRLLQFECPDCNAPMPEQQAGPCSRCAAPEPEPVDVQSEALDAFRAVRQQMRRPAR
jgi:hypothetical protein